MRCAPPSAAAPRSAALALPRLALLLLALAAPLAHAQILCASNLTTTVAASNIGSVSLAKDASGYPLPSVALAGGETVVVCSNSTGTFAVQSLNFGISFLAPVLIRRATTAVGIISDGSRFDAIGNIGGVLGSMTLVGTVWLVNATNPNLTDVKVIAPVAPTKFKMTGKAGLFVVAADGGSVSQLSIWTRNSQNISGKWIARSCPSCTATTLTPSLASDGYGVLVCGATGTLTKCFLSSDGVATYAQTATSPANTLSDFAVASSGSQGFFLFAYASANKLQTQYTTDGGTTWSSPIAAMAAPTIAPGAFQLLALADNHYVLTLGLASGGFVATRLSILTGAWSMNETWASLPNTMAAASAKFQGNLAVTYAQSGTVTVTSCFPTASPSDPPSSGPTPYSGASARPADAVWPLLLPLLAATTAVVGL